MQASTGKTGLKRVEARLKSVANNVTPREEIMDFAKTTRRVAMGIVAAAAASFATSATAGGHGIDLTGKTVEWVILFSETGGSAKWANFYAPLL